MVYSATYKDSTGIYDSNVLNLHITYDSAKNGQII